MFRLIAVTLSCLICIVSLSCQNYSTGLQQSVARADETSAIGALRAVATAQQVYALSNGDNYASFQQLSQGGYLDARFNSSKPRLYGYFLTMTVNNRSSGAAQSSYQCNADPDPAANPAGKHFYLSSDSPELRVNPTQPATASDEVFQP